jgi:hypothetical protein
MARMPPRRASHARAPLASHNRTQAAHIEGRRREEEEGGGREEEEEEEVTSVTKPAKAWMEVHQDTRALLQSAAACTSLTLACICVQISSLFRMCPICRVCSRSLLA